MCLKQGCHGQGKESRKLKSLQVREKSGNFIEGNLEKMEKVRENQGILTFSEKVGGQQATANHIFN